MIATSERNATVVFYNLVEDPGWGGGVTVETVATAIGRITTLTDAEVINAQTLERNSTHRFFTEDTGDLHAERASIFDGDYAGDYKVRTSEKMKAGGISYQRMDLEYYGLQNAQVEPGT